MSPQATGTSVQSEIVVEAPIERAFAVFTEGIGSWFPSEYNLLAVDLQERVFEPRVGGQVFDRGVDGTECHWGRVLAYEPPNRVVFSWDIDPQWQIQSDPEKTSEVEVRFTSEPPNAPASSSSTAISNAMAMVGSAPATRSAGMAAGSGACSASART